jgi:hypothetical protein
MVVNHQIIFFFLQFHCVSCMDIHHLRSTVFNAQQEVDRYLGDLCYGEE